MKKKNIIKRKKEKVIKVFILILSIIRNIQRILIVIKNIIVIDVKVIVNIHMKIKIMIKKSQKKIKKEGLKKEKLNK